MSGNYLELGALSNSDIDAYYAENEFYGGCLSKDQLKGLDPAARKFYIVNMEDSTRGNGTHWVAISNLKKRTSLYFDSYGFGAPDEIVRFCKAHSRKCYRNDAQIQCMESQACGWYCIFICDMLYQGFDYAEILNKFTDDCRTNEEIIRLYFDESLPLTKPVLRRM